jgi:hypothetical protein
MIPPASGQLLVRDQELKGFGLRLTPNGVRSFIVEKRIDGRVKRLTLGRFPELTVEQARKEAQKLLGKIALGLNPLAEREHERLNAVSLEQALEFCSYVGPRRQRDVTNGYHLTRGAVESPDAPA